MKPPSGKAKPNKPDSGIKVFGLDPSKKNHGDIRADALMPQPPAVPERFLR